MWLKGKSALITGASRSIGRGIALKLAEDGAAKICINYLSNELGAQQTLSEVRERGGDGFICRADVCNPAEIQAMYGQVKREFGTLDVMVSNARVDISTGFYQSPLDIPLDKFELAFDSQVRAFHLLVGEMVALLPTGGGRAHHCDQLLTERSHGQLAAVVCHGGGESSDGCVGSILCGGAGAAWRHGERRQPRSDR